MFIKIQPINKGGSLTFGRQVFIINLLSPPQNQLVRDLVQLEGSFLPEVEFFSGGFRLPGSEDRVFEDVSERRAGA